MGLTLYLFDNDKRMLEPVTTDVIEVIHNEGRHTATAELRGMHEVQNGGFFGWRCVDGRFRLFLITCTDVADETGVWTLTGEDAAVAELEGIIKDKTITLKNRAVLDAARDVIANTPWTLGQSTGSGTTNAQDAYFKNAWKILTTIAQNGKVRVSAYYEFDGGSITARKIDVTPREYPFRGLIHTRQKGAQNIIITMDGAPKKRVYALGKYNSSSDPPSQLTIAGVAWNTANGSPTDKPSGQTWVGLPGATASDAAYVYENRRQDDPNKLLQEAWDDLQKQAQPVVRGSATIGEMEFMPGYGHRIVRMYDRAVIRTEEGFTAEAVITNVERYYKQRQNTKIKLGDEDEADVTLEDQIAANNALAQTGVSAAGGAAAGVEENKQFIQDNKELILLRATKTEVQELANQTLVTSTELSIRLDTAIEAIELKASQTVVDNIGNMVDSMQATLTIQAGQIESRVEKNGVISAVNQTAEAVKIQAKKIDLAGYVTASQLAAEIADVNKFFTGSAQAQMLYANSINGQFAQFTNISLINYECMWFEKNFIKEVFFPVPQFATVEYLKPDGSTGTLRYVSGNYEAGRVTTEHRVYLGRKVDDK